MKNVGRTSRPKKKKVNVSKLYLYKVGREKGQNVYLIHDLSVSKLTHWWRIIIIIKRFQEMGWLFYKYTENVSLDIN
jgi:hypothetical protein